jgi:uncharacterized membrane protein YeaQ/YmgE (transglycosylase-associated protein family)
MWLIFGVALGYLGHVILSADRDCGAFLNVLLGTLGALGVSWLIASHFLTVSRTQDLFSMQTGGLCLASLLVAVVLIGLANLLRRGRLR